MSVMVDSSTLSVPRMSSATSLMEYWKMLTCFVSSKPVNIKIFNDGSVLDSII